MLEKTRRRIESLEYNISSLSRDVWEQANRIRRFQEQLDALMKHLKLEFEPTPGTLPGWKVTTCGTCS